MHSPGALGNLQVYLHSSNSVSSSENNLLGSSKVHAKGVCENWKPPRLKMETNRFRKANFHAAKEKALHMHSGGLNLFSLWGEGLLFEIFGDFGVPTMFPYIVPTRFPMAPNDVLSVFLKFLSHVFPNLFPIAPHFIPYFFRKLLHF